MTKRTNSGDLHVLIPGKLPKKKLSLKKKSCLLIIIILDQKMQYHAMNKYVPCGAEINQQKYKIINNRISYQKCPC
jgi:hypothetical protein